MQKCYFCGDVDESHTHHIIPQRMGAVENKVVDLCPECHHKVHRIIDPLVAYLSDTPDEVPAREREIAIALGEPVDVAFESALDESDSQMRPALESINTRLRESEDYDHDERGLVSPNTFYKWCDRYDLP